MDNKLKAIKESVESYSNKVSIITKKLEEEDFNYEIVGCEIGWTDEEIEIGYRPIDCALCKYSDHYLRKCPITEYLGLDSYCNNCTNTPYELIYEVLMQSEVNSKRDQLKDLLLANVDELEFLKKVQSFIEKGSNHEQ